MNSNKDSLDTRLLEPRQLLEVKLFNLASLKLYLDDEQKQLYDAILDKSADIDASSINDFIENNIDVLIDAGKRQKRGFLNNNF